MYRSSSRSWVKLIVLFVVISLSTYANAGIKINPAPVDTYKSTYDAIFKKSTKRYFGVGFDYRQFKAQGMAESNLNANAESQVGAKGIMQIMDFTQKDENEGGNVQQPKQNIPTGIKYNKKLYNQWSSPRPFTDRMAFTFASYNGGLGNPLKAQKLCIKDIENNNCNLWKSVIVYGQDVNTQRHTESKGYVERIFRFMNEELDSKVDIVLIPEKIYIEARMPPKIKFEPIIIPDDTEISQFNKIINFLSF